MNHKHLLVAVVAAAFFIISAIISIFAMRMSTPQYAEAELPVSQDSTKPGNVDTTTSPDDDPELEIIFGLHDGGMKAYSKKTSQVRSIVGNHIDVEGVAYDPPNKKVYYSVGPRIFSINKDSTDNQTLYVNINYTICGIALDWITGNLFGTGVYGYLFVCNSRRNAAGGLECKTILSAQGLVKGIAVDPNAGKIYFANELSIRKASMDGTNIVDIFTGESIYIGITVDYGFSRIYWVDAYGNRIQSGSLDGLDVQMVADLSPFTNTWGVAVVGSLLYFGNWNPYSMSQLGSCTKTGEYMTVLYNSSKAIQQLAVATSVLPYTTRMNDCAGRNCAGICVLMPSASFRCLTG